MQLQTMLSNCLLYPALNLNEAMADAVHIITCEMTEESNESKHNSKSKKQAYTSNHNLSLVNFRNIGYQNTPVTHVSNCSFR